MALRLVLVIATALGARGTDGGAPGRPAEAERIAWGEIGCGGLQLGIRVEPGLLRADQPVAYRVAFANRSDRTQVVTLAQMTDERPRTRLLARQGLLEEIRPAVAAQAGLPTSGLTLALRPGEVHLREGLPARMGSLRGKVVVQLAWGGVRAQACELRSAEASLILTQ